VSPSLLDHRDTSKVSRGSPYCRASISERSRTSLISATSVFGRLNFLRVLDVLISRVPGLLPPAFPLYSDVMALSGVRKLVAHVRQKVLWRGLVPQRVSHEQFFMFVGLGGRFPIRGSASWVFSSRSCLCRTARTCRAAGFQRGIGLNHR